MTNAMRVIAAIIAGLLLATGTAAADEAPICADRPSKSTGPCTVQPGHAQIETGWIDWSRDTSGGVRTELAVFGSSLIKYGVDGRADIELGVTPLETLHVRSPGSSGHHSSVGDLLLRVKYRLTAEGAPIEVALDPFTKIPTANHHLGNGKLEGGVLVATSTPIGKSGLTLSLDPELDWIADGDRRGHHLATQQVINLGVALSDKLSVSGELWGRRDWDPAGTVTEVSADGSIAYLVGNNLQLDAGANVGLNKQTPDVELYTGVSIRF
jgi:hypothetical protein